MRTEPRTGGAELLPAWPRRGAGSLRYRGCKACGRRILGKTEALASEWRPVWTLRKYLPNLPTSYIQYELTHSGCITDAPGSLQAARRDATRYDTHMQRPSHATSLVSVHGSGSPVSTRNGRCRRPPLRWFGSHKPQEPKLGRLESRMSNGFSNSARIPFEFDHPRSTPEPEQGKVASPLVGGQGAGGPWVVPSTDAPDGQSRLLHAAS